MALKFLRSGKFDNRQEMKDIIYFNIAENEADHLPTLTNKMLTISKLENQKQEMHKTEIEITPIIEKLTEKLKAKSQKTVNFITELKAETASVIKRNRKKRCIGFRTWAEFCGPGGKGTSREDIYYQH